MNIRINPAYSRFEHFIRQIPNENYATKEVYRNERNTVSLVEIDNCELVVKKYKIPSLINQFIYTNIRKSKARRSYEYALRLKEMGIDTATPVAYIEKKNGILFHTGYFISERIKYPELPEAATLPAEEQELLKADFIEFTANLHNAKIVHKDYNVKNIFYHKENGKYRFAIIDINRMNFDKDSLKLCMQDISQLEWDIVQTAEFIKGYTKLRNLDDYTCIILVFKNRKARELRGQIKRILKKKSTTS